ncbi:hypothetical protein PV326_006465, partial [Microctonus aethiopoides]
LHLTTMCLQYSPHIIGTFAVYFVCKWSKLEIPMSTEGQPCTCNQSCLKRHIGLLQPAKPTSSDSGYKSQNDEVVLSPTKRKALSNVYRPRKKRKLNA